MPTTVLEFVDAQAMAIKHPKTFEAPSPEELAAVKEGNYVKVCPTVGNERFWVKVTDFILTPNGTRVEGTVANDLLFPEEHGLNLGSRVEFEFRNIYAVFPE